MKELLLGVSKQITTPNIGGRLRGYRPDNFSTSVNDDLAVTAFAFLSGNENILILNVNGICAFFCEAEGDVAPRVGEH